MLQNIWREVKYRLDICHATSGSTLKSTAAGIMKKISWGVSFVMVQTGSLYDEQM
jgi:hypothetical protein